MPLFVDDRVPLGAVAPQAKPEDAVSPSLGETVGAAFRLNNWVYRSGSYVYNRYGLKDDPDHNPFDAIKGTIGETDPERFAGSRSMGETQAILTEMERDQKARDIYARSGWGGTVAGVGAGLLDPTVFLPVAKIFSGAAQGYRVLRIAGDTAVAGAIGSAISEGAMAATTPEYTTGDVVRGIGTGTVLSGLLGAGAGALLSRGERQALEAKLMVDREEWGADVFPAEARAPGPQSAGAAASDTRRLDLASTGLGRADITAKTAPPRRVLSGDLVSARRAVADLVETPYSFAENAEGVPTTQGPALDRTARMEIGRSRVALTQNLDELYTRFRFGEGGANFVQKKAASVSDFLGRPSPKASFGQFKEMIDEALRSGDAHSVPEVQQAAAFIRRNILDPWKERAIKAGLLSEDVDVKTADSYMMRAWNKEKLAAQRPEAVNRFTQWLTNEQTRKADIQTKLEDLSGRLDTYEKALAKPNADPAIRMEADRNAKRIREEIEQNLENWGGKTTREALSAMEARTKAEDGRQARIDAGHDVDASRRLTSADGAVARAVKTILASDRAQSEQELRALAEEIVDRILGGPDGRLAYDAPSGGARVGPPSDGPAPRGPLAARQFMIPDAMVRDFIETDIENTLKLYLNTVIPDVLLTERFGDVDMTEAFRKINEESAALASKAPDDAARTTIEKKRQTTIADVAAMRDRIRHTYGYSSDPRMRRLGLIAGAAARYDLLTNLGGAMLSSTADLAGTIYRYGFASTFKHAWAPMAKALTSAETRKAVKAHGAQFRALGIAAESYLLTRAHGLNDLLDVYRPQSRFERGLAWAADNYSLANLMAPWTDFTKHAAGMVASAEISAAAEAIAKGTATKRQIKLMAEGGIDAATASRIWKQLDVEGASTVIDGIRIPTTEAWTDLGAREAFEGMLARDVDIMVLTPGAEKPLMMSNPVMGLVLQYKTFVQAANERILIRGLQMRDAATLQGLVSAVVLGMISEAGYSVVVGKDLPKNPSEWFKQGVNRSGILGWFGEANAILSKATRGQTDAFRLIGAESPDSRYVSRSILGALLGPTANKVETIAKLTGDVANAEWNAGDTRRLRRLLIFQNHLLARRLLFDPAEAQVNEWMGLKPLPADK